MTVLENLQEITIQDLPFLAWKKKWHILACVVAGTGLGVLASMGRPVKYKADTLIQIEDKNHSARSTTITEVAGTLTLNTPSEGEIEIVKSRLVLGEVVQRHQLAVAAWPLVKNWKLKLQRKPIPSIDVATFDVPNWKKGIPFTLKVLDNAGNFVLMDGGIPVGTGSVGQQLDSTSNPFHVGILVQGIRDAKPGQLFKVVHTDDVAAIGGLLSRLSVTEMGKKTGIILLSLTGQNPAEVVEVLNDIADSYVRQADRRRSEEASDRIAYLQQKLPGLQSALDESEAKLEGYRRRVGSVNIERESEQAISMQSETDKMILDLGQRRKEALERFSEKHPMVRYYDSSIASLQAKRRQDAEISRSMPVAQQEILRLQREVQINADRYTELRTEIDQYLTARGQPLGDVRVVDRAVVGTPMPRKASSYYLAVGFMAGLMVGMGLAVGLRALHGGVESPSIVEGILEVPVLAILPESQVQANLGKLKNVPATHPILLSLDKPDDMTLEALRGSLPSLKFRIGDARNRMVLVTSPAPGTGKSFLVANLASQWALAGRTVLVIDADMRKGRLHQAFGCPTTPGLTNLLAGTSVRSDIIRSTPISGLSLVPAGTLTNRSTELIQSSRFEDFLREVSSEFDLVLVDSPPVLAIADATVVSQIVGTTLLVLRHGIHHTSEIVACRKTLENSGAKIGGAYMNRVALLSSIDGRPYYSQRYKYVRAG